MAKKVQPIERAARFAKKLLETDSAKRRAITIAVVLAGGGLLALAVSNADTMNVSIEAESGTATGNFTELTSEDASGGKAITFGGSSDSTGPVDPPTDVNAFTGGNSIALVWKPVKYNGAIVTSYNVYRDGTKIMTTKSDSNAGGTSRGSQYVDKDVSADHTYSYEIQAVVAGGTVSPKTAAVHVSQATTTTPTPTVKIDSSLKQYNSTAATWYTAYGAEIIRTWYPKISDKIAFPDYKPPTTVTIKSMAQADYDKKSSEPAFADTTSNTIYVNPKTTANGGLSLGAIKKSAQIIEGPNGKMPNWSYIGVADYALVHIYNNCPTFDCDQLKPDSVYTDPYAGYQFLDWIQQNYDSNYIHKANVANHKGTYDGSYMEVANGKSIDESWNAYRNNASSGKTGRIESVKLSGKCFDIPNGDMTRASEKNSVNLEKCNSDTSQKVTVLDNSDGTKQLRILGLCLYSQTGAKEDGPGYSISLDDCGNDYDVFAYNWKINSDGTIKSKHGECLGVSNLDNSTQKASLQYCLPDDAYQQWKTP